MANRCGDGQTLGNEQRWILMQPGSTFGALLRLRRGEPQAVYHYKGEEGAERLVRLELPSGELQHLEGEKGTELLVRRELPGGMVQHYEGEEMGAERLVRLEVPCGMVQHYEGERGVERLVRRELLCGTVENFEGEQRAERLVCIIQPIGGSLHYDYESGAQRLVRIELPFGGVIHFDGETGGADDCVASASRATRRHARVRPLDSLNAPEGCSRGVQYIGVHFTYSSMYTHVLLRS